MLCKYNDYLLLRVTGFGVINIGKGALKTEFKSFGSMKQGLVKLNKKIFIRFLHPSASEIFSLRQRQN